MLNKLASELAYFWGLGGTVQALLTPDLAAGFPAWEFIQFFWSHGGVLLSIVYLIAVQGFRPRPGCILRMFLATNAYALFILAIIVNIGMWLERFIIVVTSLHRDFLPSSWGNYSPTIWDWSTFAGTIGLFLTLLFLFVRFLPMISIAEMRAILPEAKIDEDPRAI